MQYGDVPHAEHSAHTELATAHTSSSSYNGGDGVDSAGPIAAHCFKPEETTICSETTLQHPTQHWCVHVATAQRNDHALTLRGGRKRNKHNRDYVSAVNCGLRYARDRRVHTFSSGSRPCNRAATPIAPPPSTTFFSSSINRSICRHRNQQNHIQFHCLSLKLQRTATTSIHQGYMQS
jgi:hypothetical protein